MPLGAHLPTSKGYTAALRYARSWAVTVSRSSPNLPQQWHAASLDAAKATGFCEARHTSEMHGILTHRQLSTKPFYLETADAEAVTVENPETVHELRKT